MSDEPKYLIYRRTLGEWLGAKIVRETASRYWIEIVEGQTSKWSKSEKYVAKGNHLITGINNEQDARLIALRMNAKLHGAHKHYRDRCAQIADEARKEVEGLE